MEALTATLALIAGIALGWLVRPYFIKRSEQQAEYDAIIENLGTIKAKVEVTERAAAEIKAEVDHRGWRERERLVLMRAKLEATLAAAYEVQEAGNRLLQTMADATLDNTVSSATNRLEGLVNLYFPALKQPAVALGKAALDLATLARIFHTEAQDEVGGIITSHVESVVETDQRGDSADAKLYRDPSAVCEARTARN